MTADPVGPRERFFGWGVLIIAFAAGVLALVATRHGPALNPDSTTYLSGAQNLAKGSFNDFTGHPLTTFPPGFPSLLVVGHWFGVSGENASRYINAASFVAIALLTYLLVRRHTRIAFLRFA